MAAGYDTRWSGYVSRTTTLALNALPLFDKACLLDIGCGTGVLLQRALEREPSLSCIGVDITAEMLVRAAARLPRSVALLQGSGESIPLPSASVNLVVSSSALHYMQRPIEVVREATRVLLPGGTLVVTDWCADFLSMRMLDRVLRLVDPAHVQTMRVNQLVQMFEGAGLIDVHSDTTKIDRFWGIMTVSGQKPAR